MSKTILRALFFSLIIPFSIQSVSAQISLEGLNLEGDIEAWYDESRGSENLAIYSGVHFPMAAQTILDHQHYKQFVWLKSDIVMGDQQYHGIDVIYNTYRDLLIIRNPKISNSLNQKILPDQTNIVSFTIEKEKFIRLDADHAPPPGEGFYHVTFEGDTLQLLVKRYKYQNINGRMIEYKERATIFIKHQGGFTKFTGLKSVTNLFPEHKSAIKKYTKTNLGGWSKKNESVLIRLIQYCDQLKRAI